MDMGDLLIAFLFGLGFGGWVYGKVYRNNGGLAKRALIAGTGAGLVMLILVWIILGMIFG